VLSSRAPARRPLVSSRNFRRVLQHIPLLTGHDIGRSSGRQRIRVHARHAAAPRRTQPPSTARMMTTTSTTALTTDTSRSGQGPRRCSRMARGPLAYRRRARTARTIPAAVSGVPAVGSLSHIPLVGAQRVTRSSRTRVTLSHVALTVSDLDRAQRFWTEVLGPHLLMRTETFCALVVGTDRPEASRSPAASNTSNRRHLAPRPAPRCRSSIRRIGAVTRCSDRSSGEAAATSLRAV
jgi:hypothetical protein